MFEETNQTEEMMLPDELFTEEAAEGIEETSPEGELEAGAVTPGETPAQDVIDFLRVKYNGEEKDLPLDEARVLAQKGMNYDKILGERDNLAGLIDRYADAAGMTREQFISHLEQNLTEYADGNEIANLRKSYPGASDDLLRELATRDRKIRDAEKKEREALEKSESEAAAQKPWLDFLARYPDVKLDTLPAEFYKDVENGLSPIEAYQAMRIAELEGKNAITKQNEKNMMSAVGSAKGDGSPTKRDLFLEGFNGV